MGGACMCVCKDDQNDNIPLWSLCFHLGSALALFLEENKYGKYILRSF